MALFIARYDLRTPEGHAEPAEVYRTALDQAEFCEQHGFDMIVLSEHHGVPGGYLSSPITMAAAMAARTSTIPIMVSALIAPLHDPVRLAEEMAVADLASGGRIQYTIGLGYRREEYEAAGLDWSRRGQRMEHCLTTLRRAWTGEPFELDGRTVQVTPTPLRPQGPTMFYGGASKAAARRAARFDLPMFLPHEAPDVVQTYQQARSDRGLGRGLALAPGDGPGTVFVSEDPERSWKEIGPLLLHEARSYSSWQSGDTSAVHDDSRTVEEMQRAGVYRIVTPEEGLALAEDLGAGGPITTHPLIAGMEPELSWTHLRLMGELVRRHEAAP